MASNQEGKQINSVAQSPKIPHSHFTLNKEFGTTTVFGKNVPFYCREFVNDDGPITISPDCDVRSYTLKAPMYGTIKKHVSAYQVPLQAILPFNWEKIVKNPNRGTDVVGDTVVQGLVPCLDGVNTVISDFSAKIYRSLRSDLTMLQNEFPALPDPSDAQAVRNYILKVFFFVLKYEMFLSEGCIISHLGSHFGANVNFYLNPRDGRYNSFDRFCELILASLTQITFTVSNESSPIEFIGYGRGVKHIRKALDFMRSRSGPFTISIEDFVAYPSNALTFHDFELQFFVNSQLQSTEPYNYGRCCAYQLVNAHYFTNDKIDYINTAELYRQHIWSLLTTIGLNADTFVYNGVETLYDFLSAHHIGGVFEGYLGLTDVDEFFGNSYALISAIFGFNYSLRFMDYFVGARPKNLAVGDTSIRVDNNTVQVVDVTKNIVKQRFLNAVARIGNTIEEYSSKILGRSLEYDYHNPKYLFSFDADIFTTETENTADAQQTQPNSVTSVLRGNFKNHSFTFSVDRYSYVILVQYTDFARFYHTTQERMTMAIDRFDMFVPELQYVGDQELRRSELFAGSRKDEPFAYQLRDMQFKQAYDECAGGFVDFLPGWLFKYNPVDRFTSDQGVPNISPAFIRSEPTELDDFYLSLTNMSLAGYFHFIELWKIKVSAKRPMAYAPQIL